MEKRTDVSRRTFVAGAAAASAMAALAAAGCSTSQNSVGVASAEGHAEPADISEGTWVTASCWHNCGGRCLNKALVRDGGVGDLPSPKHRAGLREARYFGRP